MELCDMCLARKELWVFFFQAEDGIRDSSVTGVQTCALPILWKNLQSPAQAPKQFANSLFSANHFSPGSLRAWRFFHIGSRSMSYPRWTSFSQEIGRASCRERV